MKRLVLILILGVFACGGKGDGGGGGGDEAVTWPAQPADGQPVTLQFVSVGPDKRGKDLVAKMRVFNFGDKDVKSIRMTLDYLDGTGKKLKDFPWGMAGMPNVVGPKGTKEEEMGAFIPAETKKVEARVRSVEFGDGSKWEAKKE
jgi:hypothetical protein